MYGMIALCVCVGRCLQNKAPIKGKFKVLKAPWPMHKLEMREVTLFAASLPGAAGSNDSIAGHGRPIVVAKAIFPSVMKSDSLATVWAAAHSKQNHSLKEQHNIISIYCILISISCTIKYGINFYFKIKIILVINRGIHGQLTNAQRIDGRQVFRWSMSCIPCTLHDRSSKKLKGFDLDKLSSCRAFSHARFQIMYMEQQKSREPCTGMDLHMLCAYA